MPETSVKPNPVYFKQGSLFRVTDKAALNIFPELPPATYIIGADLGGYFFKEVDPFPVLPKYYGELEGYAERIKTTYIARLAEGKSTGVLLSGDKGSGKTLLAKKICNDLKLPVIIVNNAYSDDNFKSILANVGKSVIIFDEFEKVYEDKQDQNRILTLLDGVFSSQCLFFVIVNEKFKLTDALVNRPSRLFYHLEYRGLSNVFVTDYCKDKLSNIELLPTVFAVTAFHTSFNFDQLQSLVEEMNRYGETGPVAAKMLNIKADTFGEYEQWEITCNWVKTDGTKIPIEIHKNYRRTRSHPLAKDYLDVSLMPINSKKAEFKEAREKLESRYHEFRLTKESLTRIDPENNEYSWTLDGFVFTAQKSPFTPAWEQGEFGMVREF